jgi:hypothetical protein
MEVLFDVLSDNGITFRQFSNQFYDSRVYNQESFDKTIELLKVDIKNKKIKNIKDHPDLFGDDMTGDENE